MNGEKILTISIAAYNVEKYIEKTLNSLIDDRVIDNLEIFVIDDGGTDDTLTIAREFASMYPNSIFPIQKENEGYGSTVNYSIKHAKGKYFKLLDGDDWFSTELLKRYIDILREIDSDIIVTPFKRCKNNEVVETEETIKGFVQDSDIAVSEMPIKRTFGMWALTYKTDILRACELELPSHCLYTDQIYSIIPFSAAETIRFIDCNLYCYRIGESGQSISKKSRIIHVDDNIKTIQILCDFYEKQKRNGNANLPYLFYATTLISRTVIKSYLLEPISEVIMGEIEKYDLWLREKAFDIYKGIGNPSVCGKIGLLIRIFRIVHYGQIGVLLCKICLPKTGIDNWA